MEPDSTHLKPIAICQHDASQGPAYLQQYLAALAVTVSDFCHRSGRGTATAQHAITAALCVLGSNASVNDRLPLDPAGRTTAQ